MSHELSIRLFATLKDRAGQPRITITLDGPTPVSLFLDQLAEKYPQLATTLPSSLVAINRVYAERHTVINSGDEVALFPPVSGG